MFCVSFGALLVLQNDTNEGGETSTIQKSGKEGSTTQKEAFPPPFFSFCFQSPLVGVAPLEAPKSNFDNRKESNFKQLVGLFSQVVRCLT